MRRLVEWFAGHGVAANVLMAAVIVGGLLSLLTLQREMFPETSPEVVVVRVPYPGAAPEEVEQGVVLRIEEAVQDIPGVQELRAQAAEGLAVVTLELASGADTQRVLADVKSRIDAIASFPAEAEEAVVEQPVIRREVLTLALAGAEDEHTRRALAERVRSELLELEGITQVELAAVRPYEISIEVSQAQLRRFGLTFAEVAQAVRESSVRLPGGTVETRGGEVLLRVQEQADTAEAFARLPVRTAAGGGRVTVGDVARVRDAFADTVQQARFDGQPAALVRVYRVGSQDTLDIARQVRNYVARAQPGLPPGISLTVWQDASRLLQDRISLLLKNGATGFALVALVLALFLRLALAAWVAVGIPVAFLGAALLMPVAGLSINMLSMFAFILVLGIVVDDAIVVGESVHSRFEAGEHGVPGAVAGTTAVSTPVVFAVATTMVAFLPLMFVPGVFGQFMAPIPIIVMGALSFSLAESLLVLPHHLSSLKPLPPGPGRGWRRLTDRFAGWLARFVDRRYGPAVQWAVARRGLVLALGIAVLMVSFAFAAGGWVRFRFFPPVESDIVSAALTMPVGTPEAQTEAAVRQLERAAQAVAARLRDAAGGEPVVAHVLATVGEQPFAAQQSGGPLGAVTAAGGAHLGEVTLELVPAEQREVDSSQVVDRWRAAVGEIVGVDELTFTGAIFSAGAPINVRLSGADLGTLREISVELQRALRAFPGVYDVADSWRAGKPQLELDISETAQAAGLTLGGLARQLRGAFYGEEAQRLQRGRHEVKVMVRLPPDERRTLASLETLRIRGPQGVAIPLAQAAQVAESVSPSVIERVNRSQVLSVTADVQGDQASPGQVLERLQREALPRILRDHPQVRYSLAGEQEEQSEVLAGLGRGFFFALLVIYVMLAILFRSYGQPLLVMSAIPFGFVGALGGHLLLGLDLTILSMFGLVALAGVVVNDSLVLIDVVNQRVRGGMPLADALRESGQLRFRPVLLTSLTTFAGLAPLLAERSVQAQFLIPMAAALAFGVLFATLITLFLVPVGYALLQDLRRTASGLRGRLWPRHG